MFVRCILLGSLVWGLKTAPAEVIQLKEKSFVAGKILAEKRDHVVVDLGFTVLSIPRNQIVKISKETELAETKAKPSLRPAVVSAAETVTELYQIGNLINPMDEGISLYLYRVAVNGARRNMPPVTGPDGRRYRPPIALDLHYLLSAWARSPAKQQRLLGWAIRTFEDVPILPTGLLNNYGPEPEIFQPGENPETM